MKPLSSKLLSISLIALTSGLVACGGGDKPAAAAQSAADAISIDNVRIRATPPGLNVTGAFMTLDNPSGTGYALTAASSDIAGVTEIHETSMNGDMMKMQRIEKIDIPAQGKVELKPGGYHIMLMQLKNPLPAGEKASITLTFSDNSQKTIEAAASDIGK